MKSLTNVLLTSAVFLTGASILIIEIVGVRVLSPYYGNTIFTVSSVITVILIALSCGYYLGGILADRHASLRHFFGLIFASGLVLLSLFTIGRIVLPALSSKLSIVAGPLVSALLLFLFPALLLGMMCPYAVKLQSLHVPQKGVGSVAGGVFFWSTLGSIAGSLCAGFVLIPHLGIDRIFIGTGFLLSALGLTPLFFLGLSKGRLGQLSFLLLLALGAAYFTIGRPDRNVLYRKDALYQQITIYDGQYGGRPARFFQQDENSAGAGEGAMFLDSQDPTDLVYDYTRYYSLYKIFTPGVRNVLVIGGGAYSVPKAILQELPRASVDVVDIEPSLFSLAQRYFRVGKDPRLHAYVEDGRRFLRTAPKQYDLIFSDVYYSFFSVPPQFATREFFQEARQKLTPDGIFIANVIGDLSRQQPSLIMSEIKTFRAVFPNSYFFAVAWPEKTDSQNVMMVGYNGVNRVNLDAASAASRDPFIRSLPSKLIDVDNRFELSPYPVLTDDFSPVEFLTAQVLKRAFAEPQPLDGNEMLADLRQQLRYGNRYVGTPGHDRARGFLLSEMSLLAQDVQTQTWAASGSDGKQYLLTNIIAHFFSAEPRILIATHYDDRAAGITSDPNEASGAAVLLEVARAFGSSNLPPKFGVDMVFFDGAGAETTNQANSTDSNLLGSRYFVRHLDEIYGQSKPVSAIVVDGVCQANLKTLKEQWPLRNSAGVLTSAWHASPQLDANVFQASTPSEVEGDQMPLIQAGIPSALLGDPDNLHRGPLGASTGKCDARSLQLIGRMLMAYTVSNSAPF